MPCDSSSSSTGVANGLPSSSTTGSGCWASSTWLGDPDFSYEGKSSSPSFSASPLISRERLLAGVDVYEALLEKVACASCGDEGADEGADVEFNVS